MYVCGREAAKLFYAQRPLKKIMRNNNITNSIDYNIKKNDNCLDLLNSEFDIFLSEAPLVECLCPIM